MAKAWVEKAAEGDGTYRLAFDQPGTFSMKYNAVWDRLLGLRIFPESTWDKELESYLTRLNPYGMPLDNRAVYTKSYWLVWVASMMKDKKDFETMVSHLWDAYDNMPNRIPLGDWFETEDAWQAKHREFQNRTVQGGLFIQLLYGQDADDGLPPEQTATPMAGRLAAIYAVSKDGSACWEYGISTDTWTSLS